MRLNQRRLRFVLALGFTSLTLVGCASYFKRKECEAKNWYQYGFDLAMKGQRPSNDNFIGECRKAEAEIEEAKLDQGFKAGMSNYCKPEVVYATGKKGESFNTDLCDPGQTRVLRGRHVEGVKAYCDPKNAYQVGNSGALYSRICPPELENAFMPEFNRGRKRYLQAAVNEAQSRVQDLNGRIVEKDRDLRNSQMMLAMVPPAQEIINRTVTATGVVETKSTNDPYVDKRAQMQTQVTQNQSALSTLQEQQNALKDEVLRYQRELQTLE